MKSLLADKDLNISRKEKNVMRHNIQDNSHFSWSYLIMNLLSATIACYGLFANNPAVVIGAMVVAMLLDTIIGISMALVDSNFKLLKTCLLTLAGGAAGVFITSLIIGTIHREIPLTNEILIRTAPNLIDLMIALAGGAAGAFATASPKLSTAFIGVAISTALVPPLSASGILISRGQIGLGVGALLLTFTNAIAIQFASSLVLWLMGFRRVTKKVEGGIIFFLKHNFVSLSILIILGVVLTTNLQRVVSKQLFQTKTRTILQKEISSTLGSFLVETRFEEQKNLIIVRAVVRGTNPPDLGQIVKMEKSLTVPASNKDVELRVRYIPTDTINRNGYLYDDDINFSTQQ